jgi:hypothetical protein
MYRPAAGEQDDYNISEETSDTSMYGMNLLQEIL